MFTVYLYIPSVVVVSVVVASVVVVSVVVSFNGASVVVGSAVVVAEILNQFPKNIIFIMKIILRDDYFK